MVCKGYGYREWQARNPVIPENATSDEISGILDQFEKDMKELAKTGDATRYKSGLKLALHMPSYEGQEHLVRVKRGGKEFSIYVNGNPRAAQAINGLTNPEAVKAPMSEAFQEVKNFMARMFTTQNPAFIVSNLSRDVIWAGTAVAAKEDMDYTRKYTKNITSTLANGRMFGLIRKLEDGTLADASAFDMGNVQEAERYRLEKYFQEFIMNGGETGYTRILSIEQRKKEINRMIRQVRNGGPSLGAKVWNGIWDSIEFLNRCAEDTTRFSVYMTSRQMGRSVQRSVYDAKEITVNFNKKGSGGYGAKYASFMYLFFNASIQSAVNVGKIVSKNPGKATAAFGTSAALGFFTPLLTVALQAAMGGDDDSYFDLPEWVRRSNIVIWNPFSESGYLTVPLPHELRPFYGIGEIAMCVLMGKDTLEDGAMKALEGFSSMLPVDFTGHGGKIWMNFVPDVVKVPVQLHENIDYFGKPIYRRNDFNRLDPEWMKAYKGTSPWLVKASKWLSDHTGGDTGRRGAVEINPAEIEYVIESYFGGVGKTISKTAKMLSMLWDEDVRQWRNVPVVGSFYQDMDERTAGGSLNRQYNDYLNGEYARIENQKIKYVNQIKSGDASYGKKLEDLIDTPEFQRYSEMRGYVNAIGRLNSARKFAGEVDAAEIDSLVTELKKELVEKVYADGPQGDFKNKVTEKGKSLGHAIGVRE